MKIVSFGHFQQYQDGWMLLYKNEAGKDWNAIQKGDLENPPIVELGPQGQFVRSVYPSWVAVDASGVVTNVEFDPSRIVPNDRTVLGTDAAPETVNIGMIYADGALSDPPPLTVEQLRSMMRPLTPREFRDALIDIEPPKGPIMPDQVTAAIGQIPDVKARQKALNAWEYPTQFTRIDPLIDQIATSFGLTPEDIDALWNSVTGE